MDKYDHLEMSRIIGSPVDPRKPYSDLVSALCNTETAEPNEYAYYFDVLQDTDRIYTITSTGSIVPINVSPDTPASLTFIDVASPEFYVKYIDLASAKEKTLARKAQTINRAMNAWENYKIVDAINTAADSQGNTNTLGSGVTTFNYAHLINMISQVIDYSENYALVVGSTVDRDIKLWNWNDNKYHDLEQALRDLQVDIIRTVQTVMIDGVNLQVCNPTLAYLVGRQTEEPGKPVLFVRKLLNDVEKIGGVISENGDKPQRLVFVSPNPVQVSTTRYLAVALTGYEQIALAVTNPYALSKFTRA